MQRRQRRRYRPQGKADDISTADGEVREADGRGQRGTHRQETDGGCRAAGERGLVNGDTLKRRRIDREKRRVRR